MTVLKFTIQDMRLIMSALGFSVDILQDKIIMGEDCPLVKTIQNDIEEMKILQAKIQNATALRMEGKEQ